MATLISKLLPGALMVALCLPGFAQTGGATIRVSTSPDQATVYCDGVERGVSPVTVSGLLAGPHLIAVEKTGFLAARRTVTVSASGQSVVDIKLDQPMGLVLVQSNPGGVDIEINGAHRGKTPLLLTDLVLGRYRLKAAAPGYLSRDVEFEVKSRSPQLVSVSLTSDSAVLTLKSEPPGATVKINGLDKGVTPCTLDRLPAGENELVVSLPDHVEYRAKVKLQANEEETLDITLKPAPGGLSVITVPSGARLFIDEKLCGQTPFLLDTLEAGSHVVKVEMDGYAAETRILEFQQGEKKVEEIKLVRDAGTLEVMARPDGVKVFIDGVEKGGVLLSPENAVGRFTQEVPVGGHVVSLRLKGFATVERRITVERGKTITLKEVLKRVFVPDTRITLRNGDVLTGILKEKQQGGDIKLETQLGIYKSIPDMDVDKMESLAPNGK